MPSREDHIRHCKELYGYGFDEIHAWMDGTVKSKGARHRTDRHNSYRTPDKAYAIFKDKVPVKYKKYIKDAVKDHIELDKKGGKIRKTPRRGKIRSRFDFEAYKKTIYGFGFFGAVIGAIIGGIIVGGFIGGIIGLVVGFLLATSNPSFFEQPPTEQEIWRKAWAEGKTYKSAKRELEGTEGKVTCPECGETYEVKQVNMIRKKDWWWRCRCGADVNNPYEEGE